MSSAIGSPLAASAAITGPIVWRDGFSIWSRFSRHDLGRRLGKARRRRKAAGEGRDQKGGQAHWESGC